MLATLFSPRLNIFASALCRRLFHDQPSVGTASAIALCVPGSSDHVNRLRTVPNPELPRYELTESSAGNRIFIYCSGIYNPTQPLLSQQEIQKYYANQSAVDAEVKRCVSSFDVKRTMADRKQAMRFCLVHYDFRARTSDGSRKAYDLCMNQNDTVTALCTVELRTREELNRKKGLGSGSEGLYCPGDDPVSKREYEVVKFGGSEDVGHFKVPENGPGLPAVLKAPLPPGLLHAEIPVAIPPETPGSGTVAAAPTEPLRTNAASPPPGNAPTASGVKPVAAANAAPASAPATTLPATAVSPAAVQPKAPPPGTLVEVRMIDAVDSAKDGEGKQYRATVTKTVNAGDVVIPQGSAATVTLARNGSGWSAQLFSLVINGQVVAVTSNSAAVTSAAQNAAAAAANAANKLGGIFGGSRRIAPTTAAVAAGAHVTLPLGVTLNFTIGATSGASAIPTTGPVADAQAIALPAAPLAP